MVSNSENSHFFFRYSVNSFLPPVSISKEAEQLTVDAQASSDTPSDRTEENEPVMGSTLESMDVDNSETSQVQTSSRGVKTAL